MPASTRSRKSKTPVSKKRKVTNPRHVCDWSLNKVRKSTVTALRTELKALGQSIVGGKDSLISRLMPFLTEEVAQEAALPVLTSVIGETPMTIDLITTGSIYAILLSRSETQVRTFLKALDPTYKKSADETQEYLLSRASETFHDLVHTACNQHVLKNKAVLDSLDKSAKLIGLSPPHPSQACAFYESKLTRTDKMVALAAGFPTRASFFARIGAKSKGASIVMAQIWKFLVLLKDTLSTLSTKAMPYLKSMTKKLGIVALACQAAPNACLETFNSFYEFFCKSSGSALLKPVCNLVNKARCFLINGAAAVIGRTVGDFMGKAFINWVGAPLAKTAIGGTFNAALGLSGAWFTGNSAAATGIGSATIGAVAPAVVFPAAIGTILMITATWMYSEKIGSGTAKFIQSARHGCEKDSFLSLIGKGMSTVKTDLFG